MEQQLYAVVYHHQYSPQGYRVYRTDDQYLSDYPSMYTMIEDSLSYEDAERICEYSNETNCCVGKG